MIYDKLRRTLNHASRNGNSGPSSVIKCMTFGKPFNVETKLRWSLRSFPTIRFHMQVRFLYFFFSCHFWR